MGNFHPVVEHSLTGSSEIPLPEVGLCARPLIQQFLFNTFGLFSVHGILKNSAGGVFAHLVHQLVPPYSRVLKGPVVDCRFARDPQKLHNWSIAHGILKTPLSEFRRTVR